jgi:Fe-S cluster biogenesis protein NfuA/nitrite reductase/ring-hydroxylating ferredoxin subunit
MEAEDAGELVARVEGLLEEVEALGDPAAREMATEVAAALLDLYGAGLERIVERVAERDDGTLATSLADDELVSHLLLLHGLHPVPVETRVRDALEEVRPYLESHGGNVELLSVADGKAHLRLEGSCSGCPSSAMTLKLAIEEAIGKAAPEVERIEAEGVAEPKAGGLIQLGSLRANGNAEPEGAWAVVGALPQLAGGGTLLQDVSGEPVLFLKVDGSVLAYRDPCPACSTSLGEAALTGAELTCAGCARRYDARRAGRCLDEPDLYLEPVPLLVTEAGLVKVALAAPVGR